jgi:hypothetical protein
MRAEVVWRVLVCVEAVVSSQAVSEPEASPERRGYGADGWEARDQIREEWWERVVRRLSESGVSEVKDDAG